MSLVTSAIIMVTPVIDAADGDLIPEWLCESFRKLTGSKADQGFKLIDMEFAGGYKYMECDVYACAFNYVSPEQLCVWFDAAVLEVGSSAQLVWQYQDSFGSRRRDA